MRYLLRAAAVGAAAAVLPGVAAAAPNIMATATAGCAGLPGNVTSVKVSLNATTYTFYTGPTGAKGAGLYYHFKPAAGPALPAIPGPGNKQNPAFYVPQGPHTLQITLKSTFPPAAGESASQVFALNVPACRTGRTKIDAPPLSK